jgi:cytoskeletal protein CcmA (bactofilin family)
VIGPEAEVHGPVEVDELVVAGAVEGPVEARRRLTLLPTGRVVGDVRSPRLSMGDGSRLEGRCETRAAANRPENLPVSPSRSS